MFQSKVNKIAIDLSSMIVGTKRRINMEDLADGYDRDDPFIDDSECFDEEVPQVCI